MQNSKFSPTHSEFLEDIRQEKVSVGDVPDEKELAVVILSNSQYGRYRAILERIRGREQQWMHNSLVVALGGFTVQTKRTYVLFCRENFDYPELEEHPYLCNHLGMLKKFSNFGRRKIGFHEKPKLFSPEIEGPSEKAQEDQEGRISRVGIGQLGIFSLHFCLRQHAGQGECQNLPAKFK